MRFLFLPMAALAFTSAPQAPEPTSRPIVVLVHGRGHLGADSAALRREWKHDLDSALATVGLPRLADADVRLAWYGDALEPSFRASCAPATENDSLGLESLVHGFISALADAIPKNEAPETRALLGDVLYVMDASTRCAAERRVGAVVERALAERRPVVVVAYSLGSMVTYGYLHSRKPDSTRNGNLRLITLGSPLGNRELRGILGGVDSLRVPPDVISWDNVYDPNDLFAAPLDLKVSTGVVRDRVTKAADAYAAHHVRRYLRDRETGSAVGRALCANNPSMSQACRSLLRPETS
jgi:hypothetical protein